MVYGSSREAKRAECLNFTMTCMWLENPRRMKVISMRAHHIGCATDFNPCQLDALSSKTLRANIQHKNGLFNQWTYFYVKSRLVHGDC